jgi:hypothetical protein
MFTTPRTIHVPYHGCSGNGFGGGRFSETNDPRSEEWTQVSGRKNKNVHWKAGVSNFENYETMHRSEGVRSNARKVFVGVAPREQETFTMDATHKPQKARASKFGKSKNQGLKQAKRNKEVTVDSMDDESF